MTYRIVVYSSRINWVSGFHVEEPFEDPIAEVVVVGTDDAAYAPDDVEDYIVV